jgi:hypothetical protein
MANASRQIGDGLRRTTGRQAVKTTTITAAGTPIRAARDLGPATRLAPDVHRDGPVLPAAVEDPRTPIGVGRHPVRVTSDQRMLGVVNRLRRAQRLSSSSLGSHREAAGSSTAASDEKRK